jgi:hypothetical protein
VRPFSDPSAYEDLLTSLLDAFSRAETAQVVLLLDRSFGEKTYSLKSLFRDEQRRILNKILTSTVQEAESVYLNLYQNHAALMRFIGGLRSPIPKELETATEYAINSLLRHAFGAEELEAPRIHSLLAEVRDHGVRLDTTTLEYTLRGNLERMARRLAADPADIVVVEKLEAALSVAKTLPFAVNLWSVQNRVYEVFQGLYRNLQRQAQDGDALADVWVQEFRFLAMLAEVRVD